MLRPETLLVLVCLTVATPAYAEHIAAIGQDRVVTAACSSESEGIDEEGNPLSDESRASGYGEFDDSVFAESSSHYAGSHGAATQTSSIGHNSMAAVGSATSSASVSPPLGISAGGLAVSRFKFKFWLPKSAQYHIEGSLLATGGATTRIVVRRWDELYLERVAPEEGGLTVSVGGTLEPSVYEILIEARSGSYSELDSDNSSGSFDITITVDHIVPIDTSSWSTLKGQYAEPR